MADPITLQGTGCTASEGDFAGYTDRAVRLHSHVRCEALSTSWAVTTDSHTLTVAAAQRLAMPDAEWVVAIGERLPDGPLPSVVFLSTHRGDPGEVVTPYPVGRVTWVAESRAFSVDTVVANLDGTFVSCRVRDDFL